MIYWTDINGAVRLERSIIFSLVNVRYAPLMSIHNATFFGGAAKCFLGHQLGGIPDLDNPPSVCVEGFDIDWGDKLPDRPATTFSRDEKINWTKGQMIGGNWGGSGANEKNLVLLASEAVQKLHAVQKSLKRFLVRAYEFEISPPYKTAWYGIFYRSARSVNALGDDCVSDDLYGYAPASLGISWRAVKFPKPETAMTVRDALIYGIKNRQPASALPAEFDRFGDSRMLLDLTERVVKPDFAVELNEPAAQKNRFDGALEIDNFTA